MVLEEATALVLPQERPRLRVEDFKLPPSQQPLQPLYPRGSEGTEELTRALQTLSLYYGGPLIGLPDYPGVNSPPFYAVLPDSDPESPYQAMTPEYTPETPPEHPEALDRSFL